jgi:hypothetical protein
MMHDTYFRAMEVLRRNRTRYGYTKSSVSGQIVARDGILAGLGALLTGDSLLIETFGDTLDTLAQFQGVHGEIPVYVDLDTGTPGYGELAGSVESLLWFCIGCARYSLVTRDRPWLQSKSTSIQRALYLVGAWQYNDRGLIYVPLGGVHGQAGYLLTEQVLFALAIHLLTAALDSAQKGIPSPNSAEDDRSLLGLNYWPLAANLGNPRIYHRAAFQACVEGGEIPFFLGNLTPAGYDRVAFDGIGNALALLAGLGDTDQVAKVVNTAQRYANGDHLPPIYAPHDYGRWPLVGGLWAAAIAQRLGPDAARPYIEAVHQLNMTEGVHFAESYGTVPGERDASISAAASIFAELALERVSLFGTTIGSVG